MSEKHVTYLIIGSGPTGLGAAYRLKELGVNDFLILEKSNKIGGLASSYTDEKGFIWDIGGHVQFSHYDYFDTLMLKALGKDGWLHHQRESWVWIKNRFVPYPFQNNIRYLPQEDMWECLKGIIEVYKHTHKKPDNFEDWIHATFGPGIARLFMMPYNFKVWAYPPEEMSYEWIGERVAVTDLERVSKNIVFGLDDLSWGPNATFQFPKHGGTGSIWESVGKQLIGMNHISLNQEVTAINTKRQQVVMKNGDIVNFKHLLSTMPLDILTGLCDECEETEKEHACLLRYSSTNIIGIGLNGEAPEHLKGKCWMYFPEANSPYYRVTVFSHYSPNNVPNPGAQWSLMTETSESPEKPVNYKLLKQQTINALIEDGLIPENTSIESVFQVRFEHGYPTPSLHRNKALNYLLPWFESKSVYSRGRFGAWKYEVSNQDHSLMQGVEWANKMILGIPEVTLPYPNTANSMWGKRQN